MSNANDEKSIQLQYCVINLRKNSDFELCHVDKVPLRFDVPLNKTV